MMNKIIRPARSVEWTKDRINALPTPDVKQLRVNAERLNEPEIVGLCDEVLGARPRGAVGKAKAKGKTTLKSGGNAT